MSPMRKKSLLPLLQMGEPTFFLDALRVQKVKLRLPYSSQAFKQFLEVIPKPRLKLNGCVAPPN
jgi:hypothetical protein